MKCKFKSKRVLTLIMCVMFSLAVITPKHANATETAWYVKRIGADTFANALSQQYINKEPPQKIKIAVLDTGVEKNVSRDARYNESVTVTNSEANTDSGNHGTIVADIILDCTPALTNITVTSIKVTDDSKNWQPELVISGINEAIKLEADIINISGEPKLTPEMEKAINRAKDAGIFVVVAAGNTAKSIEDDALANFNGCIAVAAVDSEDAKITVSSTGSNVYCAAPGEDISDAKSGGTSWAAPHVSAILAMLKMYRPNASYDAILLLLRSLCDNEGDSVRDTEIGYGIVNLNNISIQTPTLTTPTPSSSPAPASEPTTEADELPATPAPDVYVYSHQHAGEEHIGYFTTRVKEFTDAYCDRCDEMVAWEYRGVMPLTEYSELVHTNGRVAVNIKLR